MPKSSHHNRKQQLEFDDCHVDEQDSIDDEWEEEWDDESVDTDPRDPPQELYFSHVLAPIHILLFITPLILIWEFGVGRYLTDPATGDVKLIRAWKWVQRFFEAFGAVGERIPSITLVAVLAAQLVISEKSRKPRPAVLMGMVVESALWAMPLLIMATVVSALVGNHADLTHAMQTNQSVVPSMTWQQWTVIAVGAGVYEEMLFRLALMPALHLIISDLFRVPKRWGTFVAVLISAVTFALYHDVSENQTIDIEQFFFLCIAGMWFAIAYVFRGFGIAAGCHVAYDLAVFLIKPS